MAPSPPPPHAPSPNPQNEPLTSNPPPDSDSSSLTSTHPWLIPTIILSVLLLTALSIWGIILFNRRREFGKARAREPYLTRSEFDKRRKMNSAEKLEEEERQRVIMIRKSLATRSWGSSVGSGIGMGGERGGSELSVRGEGRGGQVCGQQMRVREEVREAEEEEPSPLRDDWKAYEAEVMRETSRERHPAADAEVARPVSPLEGEESLSRSPLLEQQMGVPPR